MAITSNGCFDHFGFKIKFSSDQTIIFFGDGMACQLGIEPCLKQWMDAKKDKAAGFKIEAMTGLGKIGVLYARKIAVYTVLKIVLMTSIIVDQKEGWLIDDKACIVLIDDIDRRSIRIMIFLSWHNDRDRFFLFFDGDLFLFGFGDMPKIQEIL